MDYVIALSWLVEYSSKFKLTLLTSAFPLKFLLFICLSTPPRVYRRVASLVGLQLVTSFITVAKALAAQRETTQRQLNAEKQKRTEGPRVDSLKKRLSMTHEKITGIEEMMRKIFTGYVCLIFEF